MAGFYTIFFRESFAFSSFEPGEVRVQTPELEIGILMLIFLWNLRFR